ncbi:sporulation protein YqfD [Mycoplasmatota bacterium zrk1]
MNKNRIRMRTSTFKINSYFIRLSNLIYLNEYVEFSVSDNMINKLNDKNIPYKLIRSYYNNNTLSRNMGFLIGIILFCTISIFNMNSIKEIRFSSKAENQEEIIDYLDNYIVEVFGISVLKTDIISINNSLRSEFIDYEWINIEKNGRLLTVNINDSPLDDLKISDNDKPGSLIAFKNGIIKLLDVRKGKPQFEYNQHVKYGDILVTGALSETDFVRSEGYVIAETMERNTFYIDKITTVSKKTGRISEKVEIELFGKKVNTSILFEDYEQQTKNLFSIPRILAVKRVQYIEKDDIINVYNKDNAVDFVLSEIYDEFLVNQVHSFESIKKVIVLSVSEDDDTFTITTLTRKYENIAYFKGVVEFESN